MDPSVLVGLEGALIVLGVLAFAWWQFRELNQLKREREAREAQERARNELEDQSETDPR